MATSLNGTTPQATYESLLKLGDNSALSASLKRISDGAGNDTPMEISTAAVQFGGSTGMYWDNTNRRLGIGTNAPASLLNVQNGTNQVILARFKDAISANSYIDIKNDVTLTDYTGLYFGTDRKILSKQGGALFLSCDQTVNFVNGLQTITSITPTSVLVGGSATTGPRLSVRGTGATSATTALRVENSAGTSLFDIKDDGNIVLPTSINTTIGYSNASRSIQFNYTGGGVSTGMQVRGFGGVALNVFDGAGYVDALTVTGNGTPRVGIGTTSPNASARLDVSSTTLGFLPPRMTTAERDAIVSPATGLKVYNTTLGTTDTYDGTTWQRVGRSTLIKGAGTTSSTTALLVENSAAALGLRVRDDGQVQLGQSSNFTVDGTTTFNRYELVVGALSSVPSAILSATSTTRGFLPPRMTTTQKNAIATPAAGLMVYDTDTNKLCCYNGTTWNDLF